MDAFCAEEGRERQKEGGKGWGALILGDWVSGWRGGGC
jgi:hypothetical protein